MFPEYSVSNWKCVQYHIEYGQCNWYYNGNDDKIILLKQIEITAVSVSAIVVQFSLPPHPNRRYD